MIRAKADQYRPIVGLADDDVVKIIEKDMIDILVDLGGHTSKNRMAVFARKPAPLQVTYLGYPNTTGLPAIDFRIVDDVTDPPDAMAVERLHRVAGGFLCYEPAEGKTPDVGPLPAATIGHVTFGSFNKITKVSERTIRLWALC
jgi:predicted O-linked N-acetylglucosamine transferase (SPINDLY family)